MEEKTKIIIGFDLGVGSVGWSILNKDTDDIIDLGSRLFDEPKLAVERRVARSIRRMNRRKQYRNLHFYREIIKYKDIFGFDSIEEIKSYFLEANKKWNNILELKCFALKEKINPKELAYILHDYLKNRGFFYEIIDEENAKSILETNNGMKVESDESSDRGSSLKAKTKSSKKKLVPIVDQVSEKLRPSERLLEAFKIYGFFKELNKISDKYKFHNKDWANEIKDLFVTQCIQDTEFAKHYLERFEYTRDFSQGPGSENSPSPYGIYEYDKIAKKSIKKYNSIWEKTIGRCSFYVDQFRAPIQSPSGQLFNLLHDLSNTRMGILNSKTNELLEKEKLTEEIKFRIINEILEGIRKDPAKRLANIDQIFKKIDKDKKLRSPKFDFDNNKNEFSTLETIKDITLEFYKAGMRDFSFLTLNNMIKELEDNSFGWLKIYDGIVEIISKSPAVEERAATLEKYFYDDKLVKLLNNDQNVEYETFIKTLSLNLASINKRYSKTSSFSFKALRLFIPKLAKTNYNVEELKVYDSFVRTEMKEKESDTKNSKYINASKFDKEILPPAVRRTLKEAIGVLNQIIKLYSRKYDIDEIVIEMARDKNSSEEKKSIDKINKANKNTNEKIMKLVEDLTGRSFSNKDLSESTKLKIKLLMQQKYKDVYDGEEISIDDVIAHPHKFEIDHIIPRSIFPDDSISNKVITKQRNNQMKGNSFPYEWFSSLGEEEWSKMEKYWTDLDSDKNRMNWDLNYFPNKKSLNKKIKYLLIKKLSDLDDFLNRNLNDTRYAITLFASTLRDFFNNKENQTSDNLVKINTTKGVMTSFIRKYAIDKLFKQNKYLEDTLFKKDRNKYFHHAIDAALTIFIGKYYLSQVYGKTYYENKETGLVLEELPNEELEKFEIITAHETVENNHINWKKSKLDDVTNKIIEKIDESILKKVKYSRKILVRKINDQLFNELRYSYTEIPHKQTKKKNNETKINKISKLSLLGDVKLDKLKTYFNNDAKEEDKNKLLIYKSQVGHSQYELLKDIYNNVDYWPIDKKPEKINPFLEYMHDLGKKIDEKLGFENILSKTKFDALLRKNKFILMNKKFTKVLAIIEKLKYEVEEKDVSDVFFSKRVFKKDYENKKPAFFQDSPNSFGCLVYKNKHDPKEIKSIAINAKILEFGRKTISRKDLIKQFEDENSRIYMNPKNAGQTNLEKLKQALGINEGYYLYTALLKSQIFKKIKNLEDNTTNSIKDDSEDFVYIVGFTMTSKSERVEFKFLKENKSIEFNLGKEKRKRYSNTIKDFCEKYQKVNLDALGNFKLKNE